MTTTPSKFLDKYAKTKLIEIESKNAVSYGHMALLDFIPAVTPKFVRPQHLFKVCDILEGAFEGSIKVTFSAPPRHGKSECIFHFIAKYLARFPDRQVAYVTYTATLAEKRSIQIREICERAGIEFDKAFSSRSYWRTKKGGGLIAVGPGGALTGEGVHLMVVDDPYRDRAEAESAVMKERLMDWWSDVVRTRIEPGGSIVVFHTRWCVDDLIGTLTTEHKWPHVNLKALGDDDTPLWPERYDAAHLKAMRKENEYTFASLYQGQPRPRGGAVFNGAHVYTEEQFKALKIARISIGVDMAYTAKTHADFSVAIVTATDLDGVVYILDVRREQCESPRFAVILRELRIAHNYPKIYWYTGGIEKTVVQTFRDTFFIPINGVTAREDKFARAQACASAWNSGGVRVPEEPRKWKETFLTEVLTFSGVSDKHDDQVDALAAAFIPNASRKTKRGALNRPVLDQ